MDPVSGNLRTSYLCVLESRQSEQRVQQHPRPARPRSPRFHQHPSVLLNGSIRQATAKGREGEWLSYGSAATTDPSTVKNN